MMNCRFTKTNARVQTLEAAMQGIGRSLAITDVDITMFIDIREGGEW
jgi:hypothetical protein